MHWANIDSRRKEILYTPRVKKVDRINTTLIYSSRSMQTANTTDPLLLEMSIAGPNNVSCVFTHQTSDDIVFYLYYYGLMFIIACVNFVGNSLVVTTVMRHRSLHLSSNYYLVSLACSDFLEGLVYPVYNVAHMDIPAVSRPLGAWSVCRFIISLVLSLDLCSCYHLVFITGCRYIAVAHPLKYNMHVTDRRVLVSISLIWVLSQLFSILYSTYEPVDYINMCRFELIFPVSHVTILMFIQLFLPMVIMMILNLKMVQIARKQARVMATQEISVIRSRSSSSASNRENKSTFVVTLLLSCYAMAWMPTVIFFYYSVTCGGCCVSDYIRATCRLLLYMNSAANVFVYAGRMGEFRYFVKKDIKQLWTWIKCQKR